MHDRFDREIFKEVFPKILAHVLEYTPYIPIDIANILDVAPAAVTGWLSGTIPDGYNFIKLVDMLGIQGKCLFGFATPFADEHSLEWDRRNVPRGETCLLPYVLWATEVSKKPACSVYRYDAEQDAFILAAHFRYGCGLKTKFRYNVGDGITGNIIAKFNGVLVIPTKEGQRMRIPHRSTDDEGAFLVIAALRNREGVPIGCIKLEDTVDGKEDDIGDDKLDDILTLGRILLENTGGDRGTREWWNIDHQFMAHSMFTPGRLSNVPNRMEVMQMKRPDVGKIEKSVEVYHDLKGKGKLQIEECTSVHLVSLINSIRRCLSDKTAELSSQEVHRLQDYLTELTEDCFGS